ncbi:hypothetical protein ACJMK2_004562 [Sinanodonta woodiana]|uniref:Ras-related protein Rab-20 n=1 Tax=Sinanodonta woodiana TaxID=1069815 RepID=A0ABD3Y1J2_SINWO
MTASSADKRKADLKVIILGDFAVGKTSLICRYIEGKFRAHETTIGAAFFLKQWGSYNVAVWDTAGDEKYTGLQSFYCRNAGAAILAFDLNHESSFESLWARFLPLLDNANEDCLKVVVGTKLDMLQPGSREVTQEEARRFAREINSNLDQKKLDRDPYFETSSKTGMNVTEMFEFIYQYCLPLSEDKKISSLATKRTSASTSTVDLNKPAVSAPQRTKCCFR